MPVHSAHNFSQQDLLLITSDPVQYMKKVQDMTGPLRNSCLAPFLRTCLAEHWPLMRDAGIIKLVEEASNCQGSISMVRILLSQSGSPHLTPLDPCARRLYKLFTIYT